MSLFSSLPIPAALVAAAARPTAKNLTLEYKMKVPSSSSTNTSAGINTAVCKQATMSLFVDIGIGIGGDKWPAADQFCMCLADCNWDAFFEDLFLDKRVIELGSGTGQVGMLVEMLYRPKEVIITDLDVHIPQIDYNISLNPTIKKCKAVELDWFKPHLSVSNIGKCDVILIFECVYKEELFKPLINSMKALVELGTCTSEEDSPIIFLGLNRLFAKPSFFEELLGMGFGYKMIPKAMLGEQYWDSNSDRDVGLFIVTYKCSTK